MLVLELELLSGAYRAALPNGSEAEWPPHPERVFSALAQAWGDGGCDPAEQRALTWLEQQEPPVIEADPRDQVSFRDAPVVYVPPNDGAGVWINRFPERRRQGRDFQAAVPQGPQCASPKLLERCPGATTMLTCFERICHSLSLGSLRCGSAAWHQPE
jgi:CRISPR-associated protein Csb2